MAFFGFITQFVRSILVIANVVVIIAMCVCGYAGVVSPEHHPWLEGLVLAFPIPLMLNILFLFLWLVVSPKHMLLPIVGMVLCWFPIRAYCPVNFSKEEVDDDCIKVMSFNVAAFNQCGPGGVNATFDYMLSQDADIMCLQEAYLGTKRRKDFDQRINGKYPYSFRMRKKGGETLAFYSKFPILSHEQIEYPSDTNISGACMLDVWGDTLLLVNVHLRSTFLKKKEREEISEMIKRKKINNEERTVMGKICEAAAHRAPQAEAVADYLERHKGMPTILCGDFNDPPNSYAYHCVAQKLDNCFQNVGTGIKWTFNHNDMRVRIDNIFCSQDLQPVKCEIDTKTDVSDHFPIVCWIKKRPKP